MNTPGTEIYQYVVYRNRYIHVSKQKKCKKQAIHKAFEQCSSNVAHVHARVLPLLDIVLLYVLHHMILISP